MIKIAAFDTGTTSAVAYNLDSAAGRPSFMSKTFQIPADKSDLGLRYVAYERWFEDMLILLEPDEVAFECALVGRGSNLKTNQQTARLLIGFSVITELVCKRRNMPCYEGNVSTIKHFWTGNGHADKPMMVKRAEQLGWVVKDHNEADAGALWAFHRSLRDPAWAPRATPLFGGRR